MPRFHQILFSASILGLSWLGMMAVHELGHILGAVISGGRIETVILHPLTISRTDVSPNPWPSFVVWLGPVLGAFLPMASIPLVRNDLMLKNIALFFSGFCLIANGAYISIGTMDRVGDCRTMLDTGTPVWSMIAFGLATIPIGFYLWHCLGSIRDFANHPEMVSRQMAYVSFTVLTVVVAAEFVISPMN